VTTLAKPKPDKVVITPDDIAPQSIAAAKAGASILHLHASDPKNGRPMREILALKGGDQMRF
jgi:uncharacterized protein (DUF849 family)